MICKLCEVAIKKGESCHIFADGSGIHSTTDGCRRALMDEVFELRQEVDELTKGNIELARQIKETTGASQEPLNTV